MSPINLSSLTFCPKTRKSLKCCHQRQLEVNAPSLEVCLCPWNCNSLCEAKRFPPIESKSVEEMKGIHEIGLQWQANHFSSSIIFPSDGNPTTIIVKLTRLTKEARTEVWVGFLPYHGLIVKMAIHNLVHERVPVGGGTLKHQQDGKPKCKDGYTRSAGGQYELNCHTW